MSPTTQAGFFRGAEGTAAISKVSDASSTAGASSYTFSTQAAGAEAVDRRLAVGIATRDDGSTVTITSVTIGGVTAAPDTPLFRNSDVYAVIYSALVPTGATVNVVITFSGPMQRCGIGLYRITGAAASVTDSGGEAANDPQDNLNAPERGVGLGVAYCGSTISASWTGLTKDVDTIFGGDAYSTASAAFAVAEASRLMRCVFSGGGGQESGAFATWGPA